MPYKLPLESPTPKDSAKENVRETFGISFGTHMKDGSFRTLQSSVETAEALGLPSIQFDFRYRTKEEIIDSRDELLKYRERNPSVNISIHCDNPLINLGTLGAMNEEKIIYEMKLLQDLDGESVTVHPPAINSSMLESQPKEIQEKIIGEYTAMLARIAIDAVRNEADESGKTFAIAIENMPNKGGAGNFGQSIDEMLMLVNRTRTLIEAGGIDAQTASACVGVTLDVNHALHNVEPADFETVLRPWFERLGETLRVIHLNTPSERDKIFTIKSRLVFDLATQFTPNVRVFMETKRSAEVSSDLYEFANVGM